MVTNEFLSAVYEWNHKKNWKNFCLIYKYGFDEETFIGFKLWRIIRNTLNGLYKEVEEEFFTVKLEVY